MKAVERAPNSRWSYKASPGLAFAFQVEANKLSKATTTENKSKQARSDSSQHRTAFCSWHTGGLAFAPAAVSIVTVPGAAMFDNGKGSSFHSCAPQSPSLQESLWLQADWPPRRRLRSVDMWRQHSVMRNCESPPVAWEQRGSTLTSAGVNITCLQRNVW